MSCGCNKKIKASKAVKNNKGVSLILKDNKTKVDSFCEEVVEKNISAVLRLFNSMLPIAVIASETDINCLECCEKHLAAASAYINESRTVVYRVNRFLAVGQMVLAEMHSEEQEQLQSLIREERLLFQRNEKSPDWESILSLLDKYKEQDIVDKE